MKSSIESLWGKTAREAERRKRPSGRPFLIIEELTGRKVIGFMSDNHIDPDLAVEVFVLEPVAQPTPNSPRA